ncbi:hypothetical protein O181_009658 [Austropuccinia psidii MF-1]|uniref:Uncharacterized protein n=1 Tax=Austropuccinia psidii MF-1 TaxID=1389203 RepID=A0A9Q3GJM9_9BASI|nr:hypothetical protein [Austropuccinia psidii MF-1]
MYNGMPPYTCSGSILFFSHKSFRLSRMPMLHMQILMPVQDPNTSNSKPCAGTASRQCLQFLMLVQAPNASHTNTYACTGSQQFKHNPPVPVQGGSLVPPGIPGASHFDELHLQRESC